MGEECFHSLLTSHSVLSCFYRPLPCHTDDVRRRYLITLSRSRVATPVTPRPPPCRSVTTRAKRWRSRRRRVGTLHGSSVSVIGFLTLFGTTMWRPPNKKTATPQWDSRFTQVAKYLTTQFSSYRDTAQGHSSSFLSYFQYRKDEQLFQQQLQ